jgi:hypothetical protein
MTLWIEYSELAIQEKISAGIKNGWMVGMFLCFMVYYVECKCIFIQYRNKAALEMNDKPKWSRMAGQVTALSILGRLRVIKPSLKKNIIENEIIISNRKLNRKLYFLMTLIFYYGY